MIDTCQANTMYSKLYSPNVLATGSSAKGQNSYSHHQSGDIGVAVIDRFTHFALNFLENVDQDTNTTMQDFFDAYKYNLDDIRSQPGIRTDLFNRSLDKVPITEFFGGVTAVELTREFEDVRLSFIGEKPTTDSVGTFPSSLRLPASNLTRFDEVRPGSETSMERVRGRTLLVGSVFILIHLLLVGWRISKKMNRISR